MRVGDRLYEEVTDGFNLRLTTEPLSLLTSWLDTFVDPPAEPNTPIWPCLVNRPCLDLYTGPCEKPAGAHRGSFALVPSTVRGLNALRLRAWAVRQKDDAAILPRGVFELGRSNPLTSACHEPHSCL